MARKLDVDYDAAKALYLKGLSLSTISKQNSIPLAALRRYAGRHNWLESKTAAEQSVSQVVVGELASTAKTHVNTVIELLGSHLKALKKRDPEKLHIEDFDTATKILDRLDQIGRRAHGLDAESAANRQHPGLVHIVVQTPNLPSITVREVNNQSASETTIDVEADTLTNEQNGEQGSKLDGQ